MLATSFRKIYFLIYVLLFLLLYWKGLQSVYRISLNHTLISKADLNISVLILILGLLEFALRFKFDGLRRPMSSYGLSGFRKKLEQVINVLALIPFELLNFWGVLPLQVAYFGIFRIIWFIPWVLNFYHATLLARSAKLVASLFLVSFFVHLAACGWILVSPEAQVDSITRYNKALYWAVTTLTTIGYGDITPTTNWGRLFTIVVMFAGVGMYSLVIGNVSGMILSANKHKEALREKLKDLSDFMGHYDVPMSKRKEVFQFIHHLTEQRFSDNDVKIISDLPMALQTDLKVYMRVKTLQTIPLFRHVDAKDLISVGEKLKQVCFSPGQTIVHQGEVGNEMYMINHGLLEVVGSEGGHVATLQEGQFFGEMALLEDEKRAASVLAKNYCDLYVLEKEDFLEVYNQIPEIQKNVKKIVSLRKSKSL